jgi:site-specific recombinase XerD
MPKLEKIEPGLYRDPKSRVYYVRKYVSGFGEKCSSTGETNLYKARKRASQLLAEWLGAGTTGPRALFEQVTPEVLEIKRMKAPKTYESFEGYLRLHLMPFFKGVPVDQVGAKWEMYKAHCRRLNPRRKLKYDKDHLTFVLRYAQDQELLNRVPKLALDARDRKHASGQEYSNEEIETIFSNLSPTQQLFDYLILNTGARPVEWRMAPWARVNLEQCFYDVDPEIVKTREGRRIHFSKTTRDRLRAHLEEQRAKHAKRERRYRKTIPPTPYIFPNRDDLQRPMSATTKPWQKLRAATGLRGRRYHLRHTAATRAVRAGVSSTLVQIEYGTSDKMMKRVYAHLDLKDRERLATVVEDSLKRGEE